MAKVPLSDVSSSRQYKKEEAKTNLAIGFFMLPYPVTGASVIEMKVMNVFSRLSSMIKGVDEFLYRQFLTCSP